jgi:hypothetical protein
MSKTPQHRRLHLLRIPNHYFDYSVSPPLQTYFAQDDHVPGQSCPGHSPPTLHRITMNLCNVALLLLPHIVPTCVVRGVRGWGRVRETRTKPDRRERAGRGVARRGAIPGKPGREPPGGGEQGLPGIAPRAHPQWPSAAEAPLPTEERVHESGAAGTSCRTYGKSTPTWREPWATLHRIVVRVCKVAQLVFFPVQCACDILHRIAIPCDTLHRIISFSLCKVARSLCPSTIIPAHCTQK